MKKERGQVVIDKIIDTAERLFYSQGYNSTGINQVIKEADIAKGSLYKHFESKTDLLVAYLQRFHEESFRRLEDTVEKVSDPKLKLLAVFDYYSERQLYREYGGCPFVKANDEAGMSDQRVLAEIQRAKKRLKNFIADRVAASGHKEQMENQELSQLIYLMVEGGMVAASIFKNSNDLQSAKSIIQNLI
jgi:AcrR family transcriptional regulator